MDAYRHRRLGLSRIHQSLPTAASIVAELRADKNTCKKSRANQYKNQRRLSRSMLGALLIVIVLLAIARVVMHLMIPYSSKASHFESVFAKVELDAIQAMRLASQSPITPLPQTVLEIGFEDLYPSGDMIDFPKRPHWNHSDSKETLEKFDPDSLGYFEQNLEIDLVPAPILAAWKEYFQNRYSGIHIVEFSCYSRDVFNVQDSMQGTLIKGKQPKSKRYAHAVGALQIIEECSKVKFDKNGIEINWAEFGSENQSISESITSRADLITIGLVGHPNVGKSSLINGIMGRTVVPTSKTPGHTKHFQTLHLSKRIRLCDCPGIVFPLKISKPAQILAGMYRIAQVREPCSVISYLAERIPIPDILHLKPPAYATFDKSINKTLAQSQATFLWSGWTICEAFAIQRGFLTSKTARPDVHRAASMLLGMVNYGKLLCLSPIQLFVHAYKSGFSELAEASSYISIKCLWFKRYQEW
ncbi:hypothetical protein BSLG_005847 [Batrachochytrium salamandrivorans]|nr:hypothetical protein BSLG_005847 [Batrachochytrium salamandrivorans]